ncbi:hypothetical protein [Chitinophaga sp. sic0106]|uniref:hypothetical protein n=1 Tax=Chitinophaga sp. sic0106 TaxID=2854785 RepID=UPI001C4946C1|nr:hypothetical protein [Chitinophaga sp. sic0106]MBV7531426.1 hypothetical protein [Chitinophaga sp. sic0106]
MTRNALCYITNETEYSYNPQNLNLMHGRAHTSPQDIAVGDYKKLLFAFYKTPNAAHGSTAHVQYQLNDGSMLYLAINCPYDEAGSDDGSDCFFYAGIQSIPSKGTLYTVDYSIDIDGSGMNPSNPTKGNSVTAYLTLKRKS